MSTLLYLYYNELLPQKNFAASDVVLEQHERADNDPEGLLG
jgi:hypothetical protein